jgi:hypothetical protein
MGEKKAIPQKKGSRKEKNKPFFQRFLLKKRINLSFSSMISTPERESPASKTRQLILPSRPAYPVIESPPASSLASFGAF